jgi:hypothetical protein
MDLTTSLIAQKRRTDAAEIFRIAAGRDETLIKEIMVFEIFTTSNVTIAVFWYALLFNLIAIYGCFGGNCCLHLRNTMTVVNLNCMNAGIDIKNRLG